MPASERRPTGAPSETAAKRSTASVSDGVKGVKGDPHAALFPMPPVSVIEFDYVAANQRERDVYDCAWFWSRVSGFEDGRLVGRAEQQAEDRAAWRFMAERIRRQGGPFARPFSEQCAIRGEHDRAQQARLNERRVALGVDL